MRAATQLLTACRTIRGRCDSPGKLRGSSLLLGSRPDPRSVSALFSDLFNTVMKTFIYIFWLKRNKTNNSSCYQLCILCSFWSPTETKWFRRSEGGHGGVACTAEDKLAALVVESVFNQFIAHVFYFGSIESRTVGNLPYRAEYWTGLRRRHKFIDDVCTLMVFFPMIVSSYSSLSLKEFIDVDMRDEILIIQTSLLADISIVGQE